MDSIVNKVAQSGLVTIDLEEWYTAGVRKNVDMKDFLFHGLILKEKDFREQLRSMDLSDYRDAYVTVTCSADAIVPTWAFMLLSMTLASVAKKVVVGDADDLETRLFLDTFSGIDFSEYAGARIVVKGCSKVNVPAAVYSELSNRLLPHAKSIMFGEPCSTVPLFKRKD